MKISELIAALREQLPAGDREVLVHCHGCCPHGHTIDSMTVGGKESQADEADCLVIEV